MTTSAATASAQLAAVHALLTRVSSGGAESRAQTDQRAQVQLTTADMQTQYPMLESAQLQTILQRKEMAGDLGQQWIFGKHGFTPEKETNVVPALTADWDFTRTDPWIRLVVAFGMTSTYGPTKQFTATVFRFETDEGGRTHNFDHAQPTLALRKATTPLHGAHAPLNTSTPAFPLDAAGPVGVVMCALRAIWGAADFAKIMADPDVRTVVSQRLHEMPIFHSRFASQPPIATKAAPAANVHPVTTAAPTAGKTTKPPVHSSGAASPKPGPHLFKGPPSTP